MPINSPIAEPLLEAAVPPPVFSRADAAALRAQMPALEFVPERDSLWAQQPPVQQYLDYYRINFARRIPALSHGFGCIEAGGFTLATHYWLPVNAKGTLVIVHGYYDHVGLFGRAIEFGLAQGLAVLAFDLPGHGLSSGEPAVIDSFDQYADVLDAILNAAQQLMPSPYFALGQSTGGSVLLNYLWRYDAARAVPRLEQIALCAPLVVPRGWRYSGRLFYSLLHRFIKRLPRGPSRSSHDPDFNRFVDEQDCLQSPSLSVRWVGAMKAWHRQFCQFPPSATPVLVIQGTGDMTVAWRYNLKRIREKLPKAQVVYIEQAGHQLVNESEPYRQPVFSAIRAQFFGD